MPDPDVSDYFRFFFDIARGDARKVWAAVLMLCGGIMYFAVPGAKFFGGCCFVVGLIIFGAVASGKKAPFSSDRRRIR